MFLKEPEGTGCCLRHLEAELMALVAEVLRFAVHVVAVRAVKLVLIVRGDVRIRRLDVLRLLNEVLRVVALRARLDVGRCRQYGTCALIYLYLWFRSEWIDVCKHCFPTNNSPHILLAL